MSVISNFKWIIIPAKTNRYVYFSFKNKEMQVFFPSNKPIPKNTIISWTISTGNERQYQSQKDEKQISYIDWINLKSQFHICWILLLEFFMIDRINFRFFCFHFSNRLGIFSKLINLSTLKSSENCTCFGNFRRNRRKFIWINSLNIRIEIWRRSL